MPIVQAEGERACPSGNRSVDKTEEVTGRMSTQNHITIDEFKQVDLRVGEVVSVARVEGADKLVRIEIDLGQERRQIVAGVAKHYEPEALVGKQIVIAYNLKPAVIRGVESNGMLLAAIDEDGILAVLTTDRRVKNGSRVS